MKQLELFEDILPLPGAKELPLNNKPVIRQKLKYQLEKEVNELKKQNDLLVKHQTPLPDNVENVKYNADVGFFQGEITGKQYDASKALKMKDHWERIHPQDQNTLKRIERIKYESGDTNIKAPFIIEEEHKTKDHAKKLNHFGIEHSQTKHPGYPKNIKTKRRDTWKEFVASGGKELPKLSPEEIERVRGDKKVRDYMLRGYKPEIKKSEETKPFINDPGLDLIRRDLPKQDNRPVEEIIQGLADQRLVREQKPGIESLVAAE
jgi:hypothetical protein